MYQEKVIAVDHGNRNIKTLHHVFPSFLLECGHLPNISGDTLAYKGKEYVLVDRYLPPENDKTINNRYFLLSLMACGKELANSTSAFATLTQRDCIDIVLLCGLPPLHCKEMGGRFADYFKNREDPICFALNGKPMQVRFKEVNIYPQGFSAVLTTIERFMDVRSISVIDIGGFTVDILKLTGFIPDMSVCTSLYSGVSKLFERINERMRAKGLDNIDNSVIEGVLLGDEKVLIDSSQERIELITTKAASFTRELMAEIAQCGLDLAENRTVFIGGGSILLKEYIEKTNMVAKPYFINDVHANVRGYRLLYEKRKAGRV